MSPLALFAESQAGSELGRELVVDSFAGGGGASEGIRRALGRGPDIAINHDADAIAMHAANHPETVHVSKNIWQVDPFDLIGSRPVGLAWFSPDCKHFSKAKGGKPVKRDIRDLAWVVVLWARRVRPRVICLENVEEFRDWGPLGIDGRPCPERRGKTFERWAGELRRLGYRVQWRELRACDYGAPTIRKRLFLIARRDGRPIVWPEPTHGDPRSDAVRSGRLKPWRTAAEIIDWSLPCPSIFLTCEEARAIGVNRPLAEATMARIAKGVKRYVLETAEPFIVRTDMHLSNASCAYPIESPLRTVTTGGGHAVVAPYLVPRYGERPRVFECLACGETFSDAHATGVGGLAPAECPRCGEEEQIRERLAQHNTDMKGHDARKPMSTIVGKGCTQAVVSAGLLSLKGSDRRGADVEAPAPAVTAQGWHLAEVRAFLLKYYGQDGQAQGCREPLHTVSTRDRFGLVTIAGEAFQLVDIGMRMLTPRELFRAQGFPDEYVIDRGPDGRPLTKTAQIRMCGNSVCPQVAEAIVRANYALPSVVVEAAE